MPISPNFTSKFQQEWKINFLQCYPNSYLKYTDLCNVLQLTAATHAELGGISFTDMQVYSQAWVLSKMRLEISKLPKWNDTITVKTWINSLENSRSIRCLEVYLGEEKIIGCETFWAVFNTETRRPENLALPNEHFEKFPTEKATIKSFSRIDTTILLDIVDSKKVRLSDLDIVNHANSVKYLEWCLDSFDYNEVLKTKITALEMNYLKEVALNDTIIISQSVALNPTTFTISKQDKVVFALTVE